MRKGRIGLLAGLLFCLHGALADSLLPKPPGLMPDVAFWQRVFAETPSSAFLVHDSRHLDVVYARIALPQGVSDSERRRRMDGARRHHEQVLLAVANGNRRHLSAEQRKALAPWPADISNDALREAARRVRVQQGLADRFQQGLVRAGRWQGHITDSLRMAGVPEGLAALPHVESSFNPAAGSYAGAVGLWQFMPGTGRQFMRVDMAVDERRDPYRSSVAAARLLRANYDQLDSWPLAITAYNHGVNGMRRAVDVMGTRDIETIVRHYEGRAFGFASRNFYVSFLAAREVEQAANRYFGDVRPDVPEPHVEIVLPAYMRVDTLEQRLGVPRSTLRAHNPALLAPVWEGRKYVPRGYGLRLPAAVLDEDAAAERLAAVPASERMTAQVADAVHVVRPGESLSTIARRHGTTTARLVALNNLRSKHMIRVGQRLTLPGGPTGGGEVSPGAGGGATYVVRRGDSLALIAKRTGVSQRQLVAYNDLHDPHRIYPGQRLRLRKGGG